MKPKNSAQRYQRSRETQKKHRQRRLILCLLLGVLASALVLLAVSIGAYKIVTKKAEADFQALAAQVSDTTAAASTAASLETSRPAQTLPSTAPRETEPPVMLEQYTELYRQNPDLFGWVTIPDTKIDYPVMYSPEAPERYLHANFQKEYSYPGTPFLEASCSADSDNLIIYAHNMLDGSMFRSLLKYEQKNYWQQHPTILFNTLYKEQEYEIIAAFYDRVYLKTDTCFKFYQFIDAEDAADFDNAIQEFQKKSLYDTGLTAEYGDKLITLVTCAYHTENGRFVVVAKQK